MTAALQDTVLSQALLPAFAEQFRGMSANEIDRTMRSFAFQNCQPRKDMVHLLRRCLSGGERWGFGDREASGKRRPGGYPQRAG